MFPFKFSFKYFQARYTTALIKGNFTLPPRDQMMEEWQKRADTIRSKGLSMSYIHILAEKEVCKPLAVLYIRFRRHVLPKG